MPFNAVKTFCVTRQYDREHLGEKVTEWLRDHPSITVVEAVVLQSSDNTYHALTIVLFYKEP